MQDDISLYDPDRTFRRVLTTLLFVYLGLVLLIQVKGESLGLPVPVAPQEPPRVAKLLPPAPRSAPPPKVELKTGPPPLPPPSVAKREFSIPPAPATRPEQTAKIKREEAPVAAPPQGATAPAPSREEIKKVGLLGLLGGGKSSGPSLGKGFSSLKEIPPPSAKKGPPAPLLPREGIETIRQRTVVAEETKLALTRKAVVGEDLSQTSITHDGFELNRETVSDIVQQNRDKLLVLYNRRLQKHPNVQGSLTVEFVISPQGQVLQCNILASSLFDPLFENEIVKEILQWKFPAVEKGATTVLYPLSFSPAG